MMSTWEEIGRKWEKAQRMGYEAIQAAMEVGDELTRKKYEVPHGEFLSNTAHVLGLEPKSASPQASRLMRLAKHRELIEEHQPDTMRGALALLPKVPTRVSEKRLQAQEEEIDRYENFASGPVKKQVEILLKKKLKAEVKKAQKDDHNALVAELKATNKRLDEERKRVVQLGLEADEKQQHYRDLINQRFNGFDIKAGLKVLRQAVHPDRKEGASAAVRNKAMEAIRQIERVLQI